MRSPLRRGSASSEEAVEPRFSVVVPCHNGRETIVEALESVLAQSTPPCEIVVVDDGSTDDSSEIVKRRFPEVRILRQRNQGAASARNTGATAVTGSYIAFLDADDAWLTDHLEALSTVARAFPDLLMIGSLAPYREEWDNTQRQGAVSRHSGPARRVDFFKEARRRRVAGVINMSSVAFSASVFRDLGLRFSPVVLSEDDAFFCEVAALSDLGLLLRSTVRVRHRADSITGSISVNQNEIDCSRLDALEHARVARRIAGDIAVAEWRRRSAALYRDDLLVRHWITVAANRHQSCARLLLSTIQHPWAPNSIAFRLVAHLPGPLAALVAPIARAVLRAAGIPSHSPFHRRDINYRVDN